MGDVVARHTAGVERPHRQLSPWLTDRLRRHDADGLANLDDATRGQAQPVAGLTHPDPGVTGEDRTNTHVFEFLCLGLESHESLGVEHRACP